MSFIQGFILGQLSIVILFAVFIKFFIFGDAPAAERNRRTLARKESVDSLGAARHHSSRRKQSMVFRHRPSMSIPIILNKTYYNVDSHLPESLDWFNVLIAQTIAQFRDDAQHDGALLASLNSVFNGRQKPDFLDEIRVTELRLGEDFPIFSNCRIISVEGNSDGSASQSRAEAGRLQARMDVDLSDCITLGVETKLVLNYPKPMLAVLPVALSVSVVRFSGTVTPYSPPKLGTSSYSLAVYIFHSLFSFRKLAHYSGILVPG